MPRNAYKYTNTTGDPGTVRTNAARFSRATAQIPRGASLIRGEGKERFYGDEEEDVSIIEISGHELRDLANRRNRGAI